MIPLLRRFLLAATLVAAGVGHAAAQSAYCERLRADLAALGRYVDSGRARAINEQMARQRNELERTRAYGRSIGCGRRSFLIFGDPPPPECGPLEARIARMEAALAALDAQAQRAGGAGVDAQRASLAAAYDANCRGDNPGTPVRQPGLLERLFGGGADMPEDQPPEPIMVPDEPSGPGGTFKTLCVRKCDGYYFPISPVANQSRIDGDTALCQASCPNAEVELFMQPAGREVDAAVAADGTPYTSLPNAFAYRKAVDSSCSCRKEGQSWVEALGEAERLIGDRANDIVVTEQKSQEMARAIEPPKPAKPAKAAKGKPGQQQPAAASGPAADAAAQAAVAASAPTAGTQSSGISTGQAGTATLGVGAGQTREVVGPDGSRRSVRVVAPTLGPAILPQ